MREYKKFLEQLEDEGAHWCKLGRGTGRRSTLQDHTHTNTCTYIYVAWKRLENLVGIAIGYEMDGWISIPGRCKRFFLYFIVSIPIVESTQVPIQWSTGLKRPGREAVHSSPSIAEVSNSGVIPPLPKRLRGAVLNLLSTGTTLPFTSYIYIYIKHINMWYLRFTRCWDWRLLFSGLWHRVIS
jgi:hypothetical protein